MSRRRRETGRQGDKKRKGRGGNTGETDRWEVHTIMNDMGRNEIQIKNKKIKGEEEKEEVEKEAGENISYVIKMYFNFHKILETKHNL